MLHGSKIFFNKKFSKDFPETIYTTAASIE